MSDLISRQAVLEGLASIAKAKAKSDVQKSLMGRVMFFTEQLPPVEPERKRGKWEYVQYDGNPKIGNWHCSDCGRIVFLLHSQKLNELPLYDFCPWCGAKMMDEQTLKYADNDAAFGGLQSAT